MILYLVHHADAVGGEVDPQRPLSPNGRAGVDALSRQAAIKGVKPAAIWHSGKLRARQTAEVFWRTCNPLSELSAIHGLQPTDPPHWIKDQLAGESREIMIVGHIPNLPRLLGLLLGGDSAPSSLEFPLNGMVALERTGDAWHEQWRLEPKSPSSRT